MLLLLLLMRVAAIVIRPCILLVVVAISTPLPVLDLPRLIVQVGLMDDVGVLHLPAAIGILETTACSIIIRYILTIVLNVLTLLAVLNAPIVPSTTCSLVIASAMALCSMWCARTSIH